jgi:hypothetical protein
MFVTSPVAAPLMEMGENIGANHQRSMMLDRNFRSAVPVVFLTLTRSAPRCT